MPNIRMNKTNVAKLKAPTGGKPVLYWDDDLKGFGVLCSGKTNIKSFIVQGRIKGTNKSRRITIGHVNVIGLEREQIEEARNTARVKLAEMAKGQDLKAKAGANVTLGEAMEQFLAFNDHQRPRTRAGYRYGIENYLGDWLDRPLREITAEDVLARHERIKKEVRRRATSSLSTGETTSRGVMGALRAIYEHMLSRGVDLPPRNPAKMPRGKRKLVKRNTFIKEEDLPSFHGALMGAPNRDQRDCVRFILFTGLRSEEARALSWDEVDFERKLLNIPEERNKGKRPIVIPMSDLVLDLLVERRGLGREGRWVFPASFRYRADSPGYVTDVRGAIEHAQKTGGVFPYDGARGKYVEGGVVKVHDLRRTFVTVASQCDMSPFALQALSNHAPSAGSVFANHITGDYVQITEDRLREPAQRVADRFKALIPALADPQGANVAQLT